MGAGADKFRSKKLRISPYLLKGAFLMLWCVKLVCLLIIKLFTKLNLSKSARYGIDSFVSLSNRRIIMKNTILIAMVLTFAFSLAYAQEKNVSRHMFSSLVANKEPVDTLISYSPIEGGRLYYFSEFSNFQDNIVKHVWLKNGQVIFEQSFMVNSSRWRSTTSMNSAHFKEGDMVQVDVVDSAGVIYATDTLTVTK